MRLWIAALISAASFSAPAHADWFTRIDRDNDLVLTAVGADEDETMRVAYLRCDRAQLVVTVATTMIAPSEVVAGLDAGALVFAAKGVGEGKANSRFMNEAKAVSLPVRGVAVEAALSEKNSIYLRDMISKGYRINIEIVQPDLLSSKDEITVYPSGWTDALIALEDHCKELF